MAGLHDAPTCFGVDLHVALHNLQRVDRCFSCHTRETTIQQGEPGAQIAARLASLLRHVRQVPLLQHNSSMQLSLFSLRKLTNLTNPKPVV